MKIQDKITLEIGGTLFTTTRQIVCRDSRDRDYHSWMRMTKVSIPVLGTTSSTEIQNYSIGF